MTELMSALSIAAIFALLWLYTDYRVERLRQDVFSLRDDLFDQARAGRIAFDSQAYLATRSMLNGVIRFSHRISFSRFASYTLVIPARVMKSAAGDFDRALSASSAQDRALCARYLTGANVLVLKHILTSPLVLVLVIPPVVGIALSKTGFDVAGRLLRAFRHQLQDFDTVAYFEGRKTARGAPVATDWQQLA
jgi:hypothetical protein